MADDLQLGSFMMLADVPLRDVRPEVMACPHCRQRLMDITDVQWASTKLQFTYGCASCGAQINLAVAENAIPVQLPEQLPEPVKAPRIPDAPDFAAKGAPAVLRVRLPRPSEKLFASASSPKTPTSKASALLRDVQIFNLQ